MNKRALLTASAALLTAAAAALAAPGIAGAAAAGPAATGATAATLPAVGPMAGVIMARGSGPAGLTAGVRAAGRVAAAPAAGCTEPNCNMTYHGGPVQHSPRVYLLFWGPKWNTASNTAARTAKNVVAAFYKGLGASPDDWSRSMSQYTDKTGHPVFGRSLLAGAHIDTSTPPRSVTMKNLGAEAAKGAGIFKIKDYKNAEVVILSQSGTCFSPASTGGLPFAGNCGKAQTTGYCAFHSYQPNTPKAGQYLPFVNLPFQPDAKQGCGQGFLPNTDANAGFPITGGHETAETITDPALNAWYDANDLASGGEVADKCAWGGQPFGVTDPAGKVKLSTGSFPMQSLWSNAIRGCTMTGKLKLTVSTPAPQQAVIGKGVSVQIHATLSGHAPLVYTALKLPAGLTIGKATGKITGKPTVPSAGSYAAKIRVSYYDGSTAIVFPFRISAGPGLVRGIGGKCADVNRGNTANGTAIDIWTCTGHAQQVITFAANGELQVLGKCITGGGVAFLEPCSAMTSQVWNRLANGEYKLKSNGKCLTDPRGSTSNGTRLTLATCANTANQHWSLP